MQEITSTLTALTDKGNRMEMISGHAGLGRSGRERLIG